MSNVGGASRGHPRLVRQPVAEAVFELLGKSSKPFSLLPGQFASALSDRYPIVEETEGAKIASVADVPIGAGLFITHKLTAADRRSLVQLGASGFSVNSTAYPGYDDFRSEVSRVLSAYLSLSAVPKIDRLGLRYINFVESAERPFASLSVEIDWPQQSGGAQLSMAARGVFRYTDPPGELAIAIGSPDPRGDLLDLDFSSKPMSALPEDEILSWLDRAHELTYEAFQSMVRPDVFDGWRRSDSASEVG